MIGEEKGSVAISCRSSHKMTRLLLNVVALDIHNFAIAHNMRLNPTKCKEMHINFLRNSNCLIDPIIIGGNVINSVNTYKILGVIMHNDLKWNSLIFITLLRKLIRSYIHLEFCAEPGCPNPTC